MGNGGTGGVGGVFGVLGWILRAGGGATLFCCWTCCGWFLSLSLTSPQRRVKNLFFAALLLIYFCQLIPHGLRSFTQVIFFFCLFFCCRRTPLLSLYLLIFSVLTFCRASLFATCSAVWPLLFSSSLAITTEYISLNDLSTAQTLSRSPFFSVQVAQNRIYLFYPIVDGRYLFFNFPIFFSLFLHFFSYIQTFCFNPFLSSGMVVSCPFAPKNFAQFPILSCSKIALIFPASRVFANNSLFFSNFKAGSFFWSIFINLFFKTQSLRFKQKHLLALLLCCIVF